MKIEHNFTNEVKITNITRLNDVDRLQRNVFPEPNNTIPPPPNLNASWTPNRAQVHVRNQQFVNQTDLLANFTTGPWMDHKMAVGYDITRESRDFLRNNFAGMAPTNFLEPDPWRYGGVAVAPTAGQILHGVSNDIGVYIADQIKITKFFEVLGSLRYDQYSFQQEAPAAIAALRHIEKVDTFPSWRVAAVLHPTENTSLYVMRGSSFNPSADNLTIAVTNFLATQSLLAIPPEQTETTEVGAKAEVLNGRLTLQAAAFNTVKTNLRVPNPANNNVTVLDGIVTARGLGSERGGIHHRRLAGDHQLCLHACPHHQDDDPDPAQRRAAQYADARILNVDDLRYLQAIPGRRRCVLQWLAVGRSAVGSTVHRC